MILAVLASIAAVGLGVALAAGQGTHRAWIFAPLRTFALAAVVASLIVHLLPEALAGIGAWALVALVGGFLLPSSIGWLGRRLGADGGSGHERLAIELGYVGLLVHQVGDGIALGTYGGPAHAGHGHHDVIIGIVAHTVPVTAVVVIAFARLYGMRAAVVRAAGMAVMTVAGVLLAGFGTGEILGHGQAWVSAAVAGLLLHVLAHDLPAMPERTVPARLLEVLALTAGIALPLLAGGEHAHGEHGGVAGAVVPVLRDLFLITAPVLLGGFLAAALVQTFLARWARRRLGGGPLSGVAAGALSPHAACGVPETVHHLWERGVPAPYIVALALSAPALGLETFALTVQLLDWPLALARLAAAAVIAAAAGAAAAFAARGHRRPLEAAAGDGPGTRPRFLDQLDLQVRHAAPWLLLGWVAAAYLAVAPGDPFGGAWLQVALLTLIAAPVYVPAPALVPLAAVLLMRGIAPAAVLAMLLIGPLFSVAVAGVLRRHLGAAVTVAALVTAVAGAWIASGAVAAAGSGGGLGFAIDPDGWTARAAAAGLLALVLRTMWRFGADAWLAELGASHEHLHQHPHAQPPPSVCDHEHEPE